jgi:Tfp pilus assembly protein PilV
MKKRMFNFKILKPAETLLEIAIAIFILSIGLTASITVINSAVMGNLAVRDRAIALNMATEGLEIFRNLRDLNFKNLNFKSEPKCWRAININECSTININDQDVLLGEQAINDYIISSNTDMSYIIQNPDIKIDTSATNNLEKFRVFENANFWTQSLSPSSTFIPMNFYRAIRVEKETENTLKITAIVYFLNKSQSYSKAEISTFLTNYKK